MFFAPLSHNCKVQGNGSILNRDETVTVHIAFIPWLTFTDESMKLL